MTVGQDPQEKSQDRLPFCPPENPPLVAGSFRLRDCHIEKWIKQLEEKDLFGGPYIKEYLDDRKRRNCRPNTLRGYFTTLTVFLSYLKERGRTSLDTITREDLSGFIEHEQDRGRQPNTVSTRLRLLYAFLSYLVDREVVHPDVLKRKLRVKVPEALPRAMSPEDVQELLAVIKRCRDRALILVLLRTGMRIGELLATRMSEVNLREKQIIIMEAQKTQVGRVAYLSEDACRALAEWVNLRDPAKERLFYGQGRLRLSYTAVRMSFAKYLDEAGLGHKGYSLHCLRHTCATELLNAGMRLECLQQLLGHSSIEMTRRYARLTDNTRREEYFRAMARIEQGEAYGHHQRHLELPPVLEETELLGPYH
ncbi:MAG: tyrosine-type recombinase/integrase [Syntrophobacterales bacterium]|jgi:site-specific recombinase XerD